MVLLGYSSCHPPTPPPGLKVCKSYPCSLEEVRPHFCSLKGPHRASVPIPHDMVTLPGGHHPFQVEEVCLLWDRTVSRSSACCWPLRGAGMAAGLRSEVSGQSVPCGHLYPNPRQWEQVNNGSDWGPEVITDGQSPSTKCLNVRSPVWGPTM